jgi:cytochrome c peroxidase
MKSTPLRFSALLALPLLVGSAPFGVARAADQVFEGTALVVRIYLKPLPAAMPGSEGDTPELVELGRKLFFERDISLTKTQSCNDCHPLDDGRAGADNLPTSPGAKGISGTRNSPTVLNAGFHVAQFWDGRAPDLVAQAKGPLLNPIEMAMRSEEEVVSRLEARDDYRRAFERAFPGQAHPVTLDHLARAIAAFERTLVTPSRFDRYLRGDVHALTWTEQRGLQRFVETGCVDCHNGPTVGGRMLRKLGIHHAYENQSDPGRYGVTEREEDRFVFKVGMLRNVTLTAPYFSDGQVASLPEAVRLMAWLQLGQALKPPEVAEIVRFLAALEAEQPLDIARP